MDCNRGNPIDEKDDVTQSKRAACRFFDSSDDDAEQTPGLKYVPTKLASDTTSFRDKLDDDAEQTPGLKRVPTKLANDKTSFQDKLDDKAEQTPGLNYVPTKITSDTTSLRDKLDDNAEQTPGLKLVPTKLASDTTNFRDKLDDDAEQTPGLKFVPTKLASDTTSFRDKLHSPISNKSNSGVLTPINIEPTTSFENSPSLSIFGVLSEPLDILTPMPSPTKCHKTCEGEFCTKHEEVHNNLDYGTVKSTKKSKKACAKGLSKIFLQLPVPKSPSTNENIGFDSPCAQHDASIPASQFLNDVNTHNNDIPAMHATQGSLSANNTDDAAVISLAILKSKPESNAVPQDSSIVLHASPTTLTENIDVEVSATPNSPTANKDIDDDVSVVQSHSSRNEITEHFSRTPMPSPSVSNFDCESDGIISPGATNHVNNDHVLPHRTERDGNKSPTHTNDILGSKKRQKNPSQWIDNKRKRLTNLGQEYVSKRGKIVSAKVLGPACNCRYKCYEKLSERSRKKIFSKFWKLGSREKQWCYVIKYTNKLKKRTCLNRDTPNNRKFTYKYKLPISEDGNPAVVDVCKTMFLNTLGVSGRIIRTAWKKRDRSTDTEEDLRGRHENHTRVLVEDMVKSVCDHVKSFCPIESHYLRKKTSKLYLDGSLNISRMFKLYNDWFDAEKYSCKAKTERQYREIVAKNFNLGFHVPKKDQCDVCHSFCNIKNPTEEEKVSYQQHQANKLAARAKKSQDKKEAIESEGKIMAAVFDFQKVLSCPHGEVSVFYYKRKLSCLNFTVFDMGTKRAICYFWDETIAKRGANEVSSCLLDFIRENSERGVTEFRFWSDNCAGQNRNRIVFFLYTYAAKKYDVTIKHSFLEKGHTQNEGDSVHSVIEKASSGRTIYTPEEWRLLIRWAKSDNNDNPYIIKSITQSDVFDFKSQIIDQKWKKNSLGQKVSWSRVREIFISKNDPFKVFYKYDYASDYLIVVLQTSTRSRMALPISQIPNAYNAPLQITDVKYKDLASLCKAKLIPEEHESFFLNLPHGNNETANEDTDDD